ncbi:DUF1064 domain-containing protein [Sinorhizobium meliloti]|uniref:DUF1064 domain-containing protein n=1 Tax=Rhizobium meliloti TaxID=382 RepID=UPI00192DFE03|nr:DUF1064 domain-containing protein [Sinorhizobium meliloti]
MTERMSAAEYREGKPRKPSKYGNKKVRVGSHVFDSKKEAQRYLHLKARLDAGEISHLEIQPVFKLCGRDGQPLRYDSGRQPKYIADFSYFDGNKRIVEDVKSPATRTPVYKLKKALVESNFPAVKIVEV